jgi:ribosomal protein L37AE/L43A
MPYLKKIAKKHYCNIPSKYDVGIGSIWKCDDCGQLWELFKDKHTGNQDWVVYFYDNVVMENKN